MTTADATTAPSSEEPLKVYTRRWLVLLVVCLVNFSNAMTWITFAPITFYTKQYYDNRSAPVILNLVFMVLSIPVGVIAIAALDRFGLRLATLLGAWLNCVGNLIRVLGSMDFVSVDNRFWVTLLGQTLAAAAQPFIMFLPTKMAAYWFPDSQRAIANTLASMSNPLGIAAMYSLSPVFVNDSHPHAFRLLNIVCAAPALVTALLSMTVTSSRPPTPVSASRNDNVQEPGFLEGVKIALTTKSYLVLAICIGGGVGLFNALYNNLQPALCVQGYSDTFSGGMGSLLIVSGLVGSAISGIIVDKTKRFEEVMKVAYCLTGIAACSLSIAVLYAHQQAWIAVSIAVLGGCGFSIYPIGLEMGVEATYPVAEATSTGIVIMLGQIQGVVYVVLTNMLAQKAGPYEMARQTCISAHNDAPVQTWKYSFILWNCAVCALIIAFVAFFWPTYKRVQYEAERRLPRRNTDDTRALDPPQQAAALP